MGVTQQQQRLGPQRQMPLRLEETSCRAKHPDGVVHPPSPQEGGAEGHPGTLDRKLIACHLTVTDRSLQAGQRLGGTSRGKIGPTEGLERPRHTERHTEITEKIPADTKMINSLIDPAVFYIQFAQVTARRGLADRPGRRDKQRQARLEQPSRTGAVTL